MVNEQFEEYLDKYAKMAVEVGVNVQKGQPLWISASLGTEVLVRRIVKYAYMAGAKSVQVQWYDEEVLKTHYEMAPNEAFTEYPSWLVAAHQWVVENDAAFLQVEAENPDLLSGIDPERIVSYEKAQGVALESFYEAIDNDHISWSIIAMPSQKWADKVFTHLIPEKRMQALWTEIFKAVRLDKMDPTAEWRSHMKRLSNRAQQLNDLNLKSLHFKSKGTDLVIELPDGHKWLTGGSQTPAGTEFIANMPTEEVYTVPLKTGVNGVVSSTKPLAYKGKVIKDFTLTFIEGKITDFTAQEGQEILGKLIRTDEGAAYLGEVALVPHRSPISDSGILFYNTLFDENASCHLAIGSAYPTCIQNGTEMDDFEKEEVGLNESVVHEDFMIGSGDMCISGFCKDGRKVTIMENGDWGF
ncbi:aminopeptidase [Falsibacillus albus]|uniref:Aminopeptidase n=2 Tax=Falsibacillus albus TaxID=2478915 RepID=A0A3L7JYG6_9BACI|nr:aminopeptidase [Falsibacillus albus]